ncbi:sel1 repeat family protein [Campylobacter sp. FMV-PI01]|uniref:beta-lactamase n=1 Tax=Campylobacter portucalensis TaxID=2608384 RepID=A0A6L5WFI4_9BACT|nr:sel1 repeat family protein [Campylobacter portucalensis]MSN95649.1 sel1 repeat family protein [Campylobacter portucalensis]
MKKNILILVSILVFGGCASSKQDVKKPTIQTKQNLDSLKELIIKLDEISSDVEIIKIADTYYSKKDFLKAITAYDFACAKFQSIPSCKKMAKMFEDGKGVLVNKAKAFDIYERSCFMGDTPSCEDMRRLEK